jgi:hypothetical protein
MPVPLSDAINSFKQSREPVKDERQEEQRKEQPQEERPDNHQESRQAHRPAPAGHPNQTTFDLPIPAPPPRKDLVEETTGYPHLRKDLEETARYPHLRKDLEKAAGYPHSRTELEETARYPQPRKDLEETNGYPHLRQDYYPRQTHYSYSTESIHSAEQQSVSSGRRTPPFAERLVNSSADPSFVSGSQSLVNTPPLTHTPPMAWRQHKATVAQGMTAAHEAESKRPEVTDQNLLIEATKKIEAAARKHPGWRSVEADMADRRAKAPSKEVPEKFYRSENSGSVSHEHMYPNSRREAEMQYHARAQAQARQLTHYAPPENLLKLHEQVTARAAARAQAAGRAPPPRSSKPTSVRAPRSDFVAKTGGNQYHGYVNGYSASHTDNNQMAGNGTRFEDCSLDLRFLDDESSY